MTHELTRREDWDLDPERKYYMLKGGRVFILHKVTN